MVQMAVKRTHIASIKGEIKKVTVRGVLTDWDMSGKYEAGMFDEGEYGYILSDETGSIKIEPFYGEIGDEYELTGEVIGTGSYATIYSPKIISHKIRPELQMYKAKYEFAHPGSESPFAPLIEKEKAKLKEQEKLRKTWIIAGVVAVGLLFWWFVLHNAGNATAICNDGTTSYSRHHSGTCSHHGGVQQWIDNSADN